MERERFDGADIAHLVQANAERIDWKLLLERFGNHWRVLLSHLTMFGFVEPTLIGERLGCVTALIAAAWYPCSVGSLILVGPAFEAPEGEHLYARALRECPPDWTALRTRVRCAVHEVARPEEVEALLP